MYDYIRQTYVYNIEQNVIIIILLHDYNIIRCS